MKNNDNNDLSIDIAGVHLDPPGPKPSKGGYFGEYGGRFVGETLIGALDEIEKTFDRCWNDIGFRTKFAKLLGEYAGRPSPLTYCENLSKASGFDIYFKREDLNHSGSHKINNVLGQGLLAVEMGKKHLIAETGAGQHGVASATIAAMLDLECTVYMGSVDIARQELNVFRMEMLGAKVVPVDGGSATLKDAVNEAMRSWVSRIDDSHYCLGSAMGPHPFPYMVREFQRVIGDEAREQFRANKNSDPDYVVACVGGGSNAIGTFAGFIDTDTKLIGIEPAGDGIDTDRHGAAIGKGHAGVVHGMKSLFLQDEDGQVQEAHSISAGLDYPGVGPEHAYLSSTNRAQYLNADDDDALYGMAACSVYECIIPAIESAHVVGWLLRNGSKVCEPNSQIIITMSGRGDKDMYSLHDNFNEEIMSYVNEIKKERNG